MESLKLHLEASAGGRRGGGADAFAETARGLVGAAISQYDAGIEGEGGEGGGEESAGVCGCVVWI